MNIYTKVEFTNAVEEDGTPIAFEYEPRKGHLLGFVNKETKFAHGVESVPCAVVAVHDKYEKEYDTYIVPVSRMKVIALRLGA